MNEVYEDNVCPDCAEVIPEGATDGCECANCGHVFFSETATDD